jgi:hypothetical protein
VTALATSTATTARYPCTLSSVPLLCMNDTCVLPCRLRTKRCKRGPETCKNRTSLFTLNLPSYLHDASRATFCAHADARIFFSIASRDGRPKPCTPTGDAHRRSRAACALRDGYGGPGARQHALAHAPGDRAEHLIDIGVSWSEGGAAWRQMLCSRRSSSSFAMLLRNNTRCTGTCQSAEYIEGEGGIWSEPV